MNRIQTENALAGSTGYILTAGTLKREIEGYWSAVSVDRGGTIDLMVQSGGYANLPHALSDYTLKIYRMGFYGGLGGRLVLDAGIIAGIVQSAPIIYSNYGVSTSTYHGSAECQWTAGYTLTVPADWQSGIYVGVLTRTADGLQCQTIFCVRDDALTTADVLYGQPVNTYQSYNRWGGRSAYGSTLSDYPDCNWGGVTGASLRQSFNRPYGEASAPNTPAWTARSVGSGRFFMHNGANKFSSEHDLVMWLEGQGYDVRYCTNVDLATRSGLAAEPRVLLTADHNEYCTQAEMDALKARIQAGKHCAFLSGNDFYWLIRYEVDSAGRANRYMANYKENCAEDGAAATPAEKTGYFAGRIVAGNTADPAATVVSTPEEALLGVQWDQGIGEFASLSVNNPTHWGWAGVGVAQNQALHSIRGHEWNNSWQTNNVEQRFGLPKSTGPDRRSGAPPPGTFTSLLWNPANPDTSTDATQPGPKRASLYDGGVYETAGGAIVFHAGFSWYGMGLAASPVRVPAYHASEVDQAIQALTTNMLTAMGAQAGAGGTSPPPSPVWEYLAEISPAGANTYTTVFDWRTRSGGNVYASTVYPAGSYDVRLWARDQANPTDVSLAPATASVTLAEPGVLPPFPLWES